MRLGETTELGLGRPGACAGHYARRCRYNVHYDVTSALKELVVWQVRQVSQSANPGCRSGAEEDQGALGGGCLLGLCAYPLCHP